MFAPFCDAHAVDIVINRGANVDRYGTIVRQPVARPPTDAELYKSTEDELMQQYAPKPVTKDDMKELLKESRAEGRKEAKSPPKPKPAVSPSDTGDDASLVLPDTPGPGGIGKVGGIGKIGKLKDLGTQQ
jgi:hypothetical protein